MRIGLDLVINNIPQSITVDVETIDLNITSQLEIDNLLEQIDYKYVKAYIETYLDIELKQRIENHQISKILEYLASDISVTNGNKDESYINKQVALVFYNTLDDWYKAEWIRNNIKNVTLEQLETLIK